MDVPLSGGFRQCPDILMERSKKRQDSRVSESFVRVWRACDLRGLRLGKISVGKM